MTHTRESRKIAAAIVGLGNSLSLTTVAEGVETQDIADMLLWLGCDIGQGWLYGRPVPPEQLPEALAERLHPHQTAPPRSVVDSGQPLSFEALPAQRFAQLNAIYDGVPVGLCFIDRNLRYVSVNKRLAEIHNLPVASHLGRHISEVLGPDKFSKWEPYLKNSLEGKVTVNSKPDVPIRINRTSYAPFSSPINPRATRSTRSSASPSLWSTSPSANRPNRHSSKAKTTIATPSNLIPEVPWTADPSGMILDTSHRWETLTGLKKEESLGKGWIRALHPDDRQSTLRAGKKPSAPAILSTFNTASAATTVNGDG